MSKEIMNTHATMPIKMSTKMSIIINYLFHKGSNKLTHNASVSLSIHYRGATRHLNAKEHKDFGGIEVVYTLEDTYPPDLFSLPR